MGIRFYCPNGHKLNVKEFQAGRRGICPYCGARMQVPLKSTRPSSRKLSQQPPTADEVYHAQAAAEQSASVSPAKPDLQSDSGDPLATSGESVWYVRTSSGEQYGPALADVLRGWLSEGRIGAEMLVWREGWPQWRVAGEVFPQLVRRPQPVLPKAPPKQLSKPAAVSAVGSTLTKPRRSARHKANLWLIAGLALAAIILSVVFLATLIFLNR